MRKGLLGGPLAELTEWWEDVAGGCGSWVVTVVAADGWGGPRLLAALREHVQSMEPVDVMPLALSGSVVFAHGPGRLAEAVEGIWGRDVVGDVGRAVFGLEDAEGVVATAATL